MSDEIKKIAALIGHHQALEKRVTSLTEEFQAAALQLQRQSETLSHVIGELDSASGNMTETVWEQKAPLANISSCDNKPCVQVTGVEYTNKKGERFYLIKN